MRRFILFCALVCIVFMSRQVLAYDETTHTVLEPLPESKNARVSLGLGLPGGLGLYGSYWLGNYFSLESAIESTWGWAFTAGPGVHLPVFRHGPGGLRRHGLVADLRVGAVLGDGVFMPHRGLYYTMEGGYAYRGQVWDVRALVGGNVAVWQEERSRPEVKPACYCRSVDSLGKP